MNISLIFLQVELIVKRENVQQNQIITIFFTLILALALTLMGLDLEIQVVVTTLKVANFHLIEIYFVCFSLETYWTCHRNVLPVYFDACTF